MNQDAFKRVVVKSIVDRSLRNIRRDPRRGIRRLADLGEVAAAGPYQKRFLSIVRRMLEQEDSPYYTMVSNAVQSADNERLKTFGLNFGWNCLTVGTRKIRALEQTQPWSIPWSLTVHIGGAPGDLDAHLRQAGALYFLYRTYDGPDEARDITSGRWAGELASLAGIGSICVAGQDCPARCGAQVYQYARRSRLEQRYPTLVLDYYLDNLYTDACISHTACLSGICPNGELTRFRDGREYPTGLSVRSARLDEVLAQIPARTISPPREDLHF